MGGMFLISFLSISLTAPIVQAEEEEPIVQAEEEPIVQAEEEQLLLGEAAFLELVAVENDQVRNQRIEVEISDQMITNAWSAFEPKIEASFLREFSREQNDTAQSVQRRLTSVYINKNRAIGFALSGLTPIGTKYKVYIKQDDQYNTLQAFENEGQEYLTTRGVEITQPLLKGFGLDANLSSVNVAEKEREISKRQLEQTKMGKVYQGAVSFADLQLAQMKFLAEGELLLLEKERSKIVRKLAETGRAPTSAVFKAESSLALREARQEFSRKLLHKASASVRRLLVGRKSNPLKSILAIDPIKEISLPAIVVELQNSTDGVKRPDLDAAQMETQREKIRADFAGNQQLVGLDLKVTAGETSLATGGRKSLDRLSQKFNFYSFGLYFTIPLAGGFQSDSAAAVANARHRQAQLTEMSLKNTVRDEVFSALGEMESTMAEAKLVHNALVESKRGLDSSRANAKEGALPRFDLLRQEGMYIQGTANYKEKLVNVKKALLNVLLASGTLLRFYNLDGKI